MQDRRGLRFVKQQGVTEPVQQDAHPLGSRRHPEQDLLARVPERVLAVVVGQHPRLVIVSQPGHVPGAFALEPDVADAHLEGGALAHIHHPAASAGGQRQGAEGIGPAVEARRVVRWRLAGLLLEEGQSAAVVGERQEGISGAFVKL